MKISRLERFTLCITALAIAFLAGWFLCRQYEARRAFTPAPAEAAASAGVTPSPIPSGAEEEQKVNINTADAAALATLPGIGEKRAAGIIAYREENGPFPNPEAITDVPGIGEATLKEIIDRITVED